MQRSLGPPCAPAQLRWARPARSPAGANPSGSQTLSHASAAKLGLSSPDPDGSNAVGAPLRRYALQGMAGRRYAAGVPGTWALVRGEQPTGKLRGRWPSEAGPVYLSPTPRPGTAGQRKAGQAVVIGATRMPCQSMAALGCFSRRHGRCNQSLSDSGSRARRATGPLAGHALRGFPKDGLGTLHAPRRRRQAFSQLLGHTRLACFAPMLRGSWS